MISPNGKELIPITEPPNVGDIVYHENYGLVKYRVREDYSGNHRKHYPELVLVEVMRDMGDGYFKPGHQSIRELDELLKEAMA